MILILQLRKAIEDVNSGNIPVEQLEVPEKPLSPQEEPLLSNKDANNTVTSMDSALSNSDNNSDIELGNMDSKDMLKK